MTNIPILKNKESNIDKRPEYLVDIPFLFGHTVDITHFLSLEGFIVGLNEISRSFERLNLPMGYSDDQLYFIYEEGFTAVKIGLSTRPNDRLMSLQTGNPKRLRILYFYDPVLHGKNSIFEDQRSYTARDFEQTRLKWYAGGFENLLVGEWFKPNSRAFRMLIREGYYLLKWYNENTSNLNR